VQDLAANLQAVQREAKRRASQAMPQQF